MIRTNTKDLFQLQSELVDMKVNMAVETAIDRVVNQISSLEEELKGEIHDLRIEMNARFLALENRVTALENRVVAIETKLGMVSETRREIRSRLLDHAFRAGWLLLGVIISAAIMRLQM